MKIRFPRALIVKLQLASAAFDVPQAEIIRKAFRKGNRLCVVVDTKLITTTRDESEVVEVADLEGDPKRIIGLVDWYLGLPQHDPANVRKSNLDEEVGIFQQVSFEQIYGR